MDALRPRVDVRSYFVRRDFARRPRHASSPAAFTQRSSRWSASIGRPNHDVDERRRRAIGAKLLQTVARCDALLVSDYGGGAVTSPLVAEAQKCLRRRGHEAAPVTHRFAILAVPVSRHDDLHAERIRGRTAARHPHWRQYANPRTRRPRTAPTDAIEAVLITRGSRGMALFETGTPTVHIPIFGSIEIADVTGAGDTVIATMTLALAAGAIF